MSKKVDIGLFISKVPILNKFELDKVWKFIQLVFTKPAIASSLAVLIWTGMEYNKTKEETLLFLFIYATLSFFILVIIDAKLYFAIQKTKEDARIHLAEIAKDEKIRLQKLSDRKEELDLINDLVRSREGIRSEWLKGWREVILFKLALERDHMQEVLKLSPSEARDQVLATILDQFNVTYQKYIDLMPFTDSSMSEFQIGMQSPPPKPTQNSVEELTEMLERLKSIDDI